MAKQKLAMFHLLLQYSSSRRNLPVWKLHTIPQQVLLRRHSSLPHCCQCGFRLLPLRLQYLLLFYLPHTQVTEACLARFRRAILGGGHNWQTVLRVAWTQLHQTWRERRVIMTTQEGFFRVRISCCIFKCGQLEVEWCWKLWGCWARCTDKKSKKFHG